MKLNELIGANIKNLRSALGIKAETLANDIGVSKATLSLIENGKTDVSVERLSIIAAKLNVPITVLLPQQGTNIQVSRENSTQNIINGVQNLHHMDSNTYQALMEIANQLKSILNKS